MPLSKIKAANVTRPPLAPAEAVQLHLAPLDQLRVVEGVCRGDRLQSSYDLCAGDVFRMPAPDAQFQASCRAGLEPASVDVWAASRFGPTAYKATLTHRVTFMTDTAQQLTGYVLNGAEGGNRTGMLFTQDPDPATDYILVEIAPFDATDMDQDLGGLATRIRLAAAMSGYGPRRDIPAPLAAQAG